MTKANVHLPKDRVSMSHQGLGFCEFLIPEDAEYACKIMNQVRRVYLSQTSSEMLTI